MADFKAEVNDLLKKLGDIVRLKALPYECSPLHQAVKDESLEKVKQCLANGEDIDMKDSKGLTPLMFAIFAANEDIFHYRFPMFQQEVL